MAEREERTNVMRAQMGPPALKIVPQATEPAKIRFKLVTYNIRKGKGIRGARPELADLSNSLLEIAPDVLLCQEVFHGTSGSVQQTQHFAATLALLHRYGANANYRKGNHGNSTFSRFPISRHQNRDISTNRVERRGVLYTRVYPAPNARLHVFNTHFGLSQRQRQIQARELGRLICEQAAPGDPVVVGGDFNDWSGRVDPVICTEGEVENAMLALAMRDRRTFSTRRPLFALDRIYYRNIHLVEISVLRSSPWDRLSDHFPVAAVFELAVGDVR